MSDAISESLNGIGGLVSSDNLLKQLVIWFFLIASMVLVIPIVYVIPLLYGYGARVFEVALNNESTLPEIRFGDDFILGVKYILLASVYYIPTVVYVLVWISSLFVAIPSMSAADPSAMATAVAGSAGAAFLLGAVLLPIVVFVNQMLFTFALRDMVISKSFFNSFQFKKHFKGVWNLQFFVLFVLSIVIGGTISIIQQISVWLLVGIPLVPVFTFVTVVLTHYVFGHAVRASLEEQNL